MVTTCPICIEPLTAKSFGNTAPCGHYFHEECYNHWAASSSKLLVTGEYCTKCPTCNTACTSFIRSYLDLDQMNFDDVRISSDEEDVDSSCDGNNDDGTSDRSDHHNLNDSQNDDNESRTRSIANSNRSSHPDEIICLDDDEDEISINGSGRLNRGRNKTPKTRDKQNKNSKEYLKRKYKVLKRKFKNAKDLVAQQQQKNQEMLTVKARNDSLRKDNTALTAKVEKDSYDSRHIRHQLDDLTRSVNRYEVENNKLKERLISDNFKYSREKARLSEQVENSKASNMEEIKEIAKQKKTFVEKYDSITRAWKSEQIENKDLAKENAKLKRILREYANEEVEELSKARKLEKPMSRSKKLEMVKLARIEADNASLAEEEEARALRRRIERKNMLKNSSSQMNRVAAAAKKQQKRKSRPAFLSTSTTSSKSMQESKPGRRLVQKTRIPGMGIASNDLRNIFKKK